MMSVEAADLLSVFCVIDELFGVMVDTTCCGVDL